MLILKFVRAEQEGTVFETVACDHFSVYDKTNGIKLVVTYKDHTNTQGVERCIGEKLKGRQDPINVGFDSCFVMDSSGKTIDTIKAVK